MSAKSRRLVRALGVIVLLGAIDSLTKRLAERLLAGQEDVLLIPGVLQLHYLENTGAAFGMLQGMYGVFLVLTALVCCGIVYLFLRIPEDKKYRPLLAVLTVLLSGALGNAVDRIRLHYVVDFIYVSLIDFPVFNVADIYVTVSVAALVVLLVFVYKDEDLDAVLGGH